MKINGEHSLCDNIANTLIRHFYTYSFNLKTRPEAFGLWTMNHHNKESAINIC